MQWVLANERTETVQQWQMREYLAESRQKFMEEKGRLEREWVCLQTERLRAETAKRSASSGATTSSPGADIGGIADAGEEKVVELVERLLAEWPGVRDAVPR